MGLEVNPVADEVGPIATLFLLHEKNLSPALFLGTSSDRIGSPKGTQSYYATAAKSLGGWPASVYASLNYSEWDEGLNVPFGATVDLGHGFSMQPMYDGARTHLLASWSSSRYSITAIHAWLERFGFAVSAGF